MAVTADARLERIRAQWLARHRKKKPQTITTVGLPSRQRAQTIKQSKLLKRKQRRWTVKSTAQKLLGKDLSSSFVSQLDYNTENGDVDVVLSGKKYRFFNVPEAIFNSWTKGGATCQTSDSGKKKRWWLGKTPSLGAFFNTYISSPMKGKGNFGKRIDKYTMVTGWVT